MLSLLLHTFTSICVLTARVSAVTMETVVGVAGRRVMLPCRAEAVSQRGVEVCWGRGESALFSCRNTVIHAAGGHVTYRKSNRFSVSSSSSFLSIFSSRSSDSGLYHCRVELPGLFNDQTSTVHLIIISPRPAFPDSPVKETTQLADGRVDENLNAPHTTTQYSSTRGSDVIKDSSRGPMVAQVQSSVQQQQLVDRLQSFIGNTARASFIIFIPAVLLTAAYRLWRTNQRAQTDRKLNQSEEEDSSV